MEQMPRAFVEAQDALQVEDEKFYSGGLFQHIAHHGLGGGECEMTLQLINVDRFRQLAEKLIFPGGADVVGIEFRAGEFQPDAEFADDRAVEQVQVEMARQFLTYADATNAVAVRIKTRRK